MYWKSHGRMEFHADHWATMLPKNLNQVPTALQVPKHIRHSFQAILIGPMSRQYLKASGIHP